MFFPSFCMPVYYYNLYYIVGLIVGGKTDRKMAPTIGLLVSSLLSLPTQSVVKSPRVLPARQWLDDARLHSIHLDQLLYPPAGDGGDDDIKARQHLVNAHPIYNFLHTYYRYTKANLRYYSPGLDVRLEEGSSRSELNAKYLCTDGASCWYALPANSPDGPHGWVTLSRTRDLLASTASRPAFFGCFGWHEWAMLYSGRRDGLSAPLALHQKLPVRVSQAVIDDVVEGTGALRCTHYDAYRFFHPSAQPLNAVHPLTRATQADHEQPGCVHAAMDLFKYAYQLYPFCAAELLRECIGVALAAREVDVRASPYDASGVAHCGPPICVETHEGRREYVELQEALATRAAPVRQRLIDAYDLALAHLARPQA